jgi:hypothetical protein
MLRRCLLLLSLFLLVREFDAQEHVFTAGGRLRMEAPRVFEGRIAGVVHDFTTEGVTFEESEPGVTYLVSPAQMRYVAKFRGNDRRT